MAGSLRKWIVRSLIVVAFFYTTIYSVNPASRLALIESLLERGTPATEDSPFFNPVDMVYDNGHFYSDKPPLLALYSTVVVAPVRAVLEFDGIGGKVLYWLIVASASGLALWVMALSIRALKPLLSGQLTWKWLAVGAIGATCVLPFARTYNDHILEAAALLAIFVLLVDRSRSHGYRRPLAIGVLTGLVWSLHPLVGSVTAFTTVGYYLLAPIRGVELRRSLVVVVFALGAIGPVASLTGVHQVMYGRALPYYFSPGLYLWTDGPRGEESAWLDEPTMPGLTDERITARFEELGLPEDRLQRTLVSFAAYEESVRNPVAFSVRRLFRYGQLTFNALVLFCVLLALAGLRRRETSVRAETLWAIASALGLLAASVALRAVPGGSFGDRHLLPIVPLLVCVGGLAVRSAGEAGLFRALVVMCVAMMFPGTLGPWITPGDFFLVVNLGVTVLVVAAAVWIWRAGPGTGVSQTWNRLEARLSGRAAILLLMALSTLEVTLYLITLPSG